MPGQEESFSGGSSLRTVSADSGMSAAPAPAPPPPPPLHRVPSWEDRIYLAASNQVTTLFIIQHCFICRPSDSAEIEPMQGGSDFGIGWQTL